MHVKTLMKVPFQGFGSLLAGHTNGKEDYWEPALLGKAFIPKVFEWVPCAMADFAEVRVTLLMPRVYAGVRIF